MAGLFLREQFLIQRGQDFHGAHVGDGDVAGSVRTTVSEGDHSGVREGKRAAASSARGGSKVVGNFLESAVSGIETDLGIAFAIVSDINAAVVGRPLRILDIAVELVGKGMGIGAVAIHEVKLGGLMALVAVIVAGVGNELAIRRDGGRIIGAFASGQGTKRAVSHAELVNFGVLIFVIGFGMAVDGSDQILAIGRPGRAIGAELVAAIRKTAVGDLARGAAFAIYHEELHVAGLEIAGAIETINQTIVGNGWIGPLRAGRR